jgi:hypothetical protein
MIAKKITKEEQETKLQINASKSLANMRKKPGFMEWVSNDKTAFKIIYLTGTFGGVLVMLMLFGMSLYFDFDIFFKILFGVLLTLQGWNTYKMVRDHKNLNMSVNDMVYKDKNKNNTYEQKKSLYDKSKENINGMAA